MQQQKKEERLQEAYKLGQSSGYWFTTICVQMLPGKAGEKSWVFFASGRNLFGSSSKIIIFRRDYGWIYG